MRKGILLCQTTQCLFQDDIVNSHSQITGLAVGIVVHHLFRQLMYVGFPVVESVPVFNDPIDPLRQKIRQILFILGGFSR